VKRERPVRHKEGFGTRKYRGPPSCGGGDLGKCPKCIGGKGGGGKKRHEKGKRKEDVGHAHSPNVPKLNRVQQYGKRRGSQRTEKKGGKGEWSRWPARITGGPKKTCSLEDSKSRRPGRGKGNRSPATRIELGRRSGGIRNGQTT